MSMGLMRISMQSSLLPATKAMCLDGSRCVYCSSQHMHTRFCWYTQWIKWYHLVQYYDRIKSNSLGQMACQGVHAQHIGRERKGFMQPGWVGKVCLVQQQMQSSLWKTCAMPSTKLQIYQIVPNLKNMSQNVPLQYQDNISPLAKSCPLTFPLLGLYSIDNPSFFI